MAQHALCLALIGRDRVVADLDLRGSGGLARRPASATGGIDADKRHQLTSLIGYLYLSAGFSNIPRQFGDLRPDRSWMTENDGLDCRDRLIPVEHVEIVSGHSSPRANRLAIKRKTCEAGFGSMARR